MSHILEYKDKGYICQVELCPDHYALHLLDFSTTVQLSRNVVYTGKQKRLNKTRFVITDVIKALYVSVCRFQIVIWHR